LVDLVSDFAKCVQRVDSIWVSLFKAKDIVNPGVKIAWNVLTFKSFSHNLYEFDWISFWPFRQNYVVNLSAILLHAKIA